MVNIPVRFKRTMAAAFDEMSRVRSCESSGSEHSADLSDLVNSFFEREIRERRRMTSDEEVDGGLDANDEINNAESEGGNNQDFGFQQPLKKLFDREKDGVERSIIAEVEKVLEEEVVGKNSSPEFKRRLMAELRSRGFDAGLCKSKWEKNGRNTSGNYEYIDVNAGADRYIIEVSLAGEFAIARPTDSYASVLEVFPAVFVGKPDELKKVVKLMSRAIRKSMKSVDLTVPPWRRQVYMQAKWFSSYKRTVQEISPGGKAPADLAGNRLVGFAPVMGASTHYCREDFATKSGVAIGYLAAALN